MGRQGPVRVRGLVGRRRDVRELSLVIDALVAGRGDLVLISGEAGIGKTRLAEEAAMLAGQAGLDALWVTCLAESGSPPFWPWPAIIRGLTTRGEPGVPVEMDPLVARLAGEHDPRLEASELDAEFARFRLFEATWDLIRRVSGQRRLFVVIDDCHWADSAALQLLRFVAPLLHSVPVVIAATYREGEADSQSGLGAVLPDLVRHGRQLFLEGLSRAELAHFVASETGDQPSAAVAAELHRHTGGNPFFAREVVRVLDARDSMERITMSEAPLPASLLGILTRQFCRLTQESRQVVEVAATAGTEFGMDLLGEAVALEKRRILDALGEAQEFRVLREAAVGRWAFVHPLMREAVYSELGLAHRVQLHCQIGEALERLRDRGAEIDAAALAYHFVAAAPGGNAAKAMGYAEQAGRHAMAMLAYEDAADHYEHALRALALCPPDPRRHADLLCDLGDAWLAAGELPRARTAFGEAVKIVRHRDSPGRLGRAVLGFAAGPGGFEVPLGDQAQIDLLEEAIQALEPGPSSMRAWLSARLSVALSYTAPVEGRLALAEASVGTARQIGDRAALASALAARCDAMAGPADSERRLKDASVIVEVAGSLGDRRMELLGRRMRLVALLEVGDIVDADAEIAAFARLATAIRQPLYEWYAPLWRGMRALMEGRCTQAQRHAAEAESIGARAHSDNARVLSGLLSAVIAIERGEPDSAVEFAESLVARPEVPDVAALPGLAYVLVESGRLREATATLDRVALDYESHPIDAEWLPLNACLANAIAGVGGHPLAVRAYELLRPYESRFAFEGIGCAMYGSVARSLGQLAATLGHLRDAHAHFQVALEANHNAGATLLVAHTLRDAGYALGELSMLHGAIELYRNLGIDHRIAAIEATLEGATPASADDQGRNRFRREGDTWALRYAGRTIRLTNTKGLEDLSRLLAQPGREIHVLDLMTPEAGLASGHAGEAIDARARREYKARLSQIARDLDEADAAGDLARSERLHSEHEILQAELSSAYGLGGRPRRPGDPAERARSAVTRRIRDALHRIESAHAPLGRHLHRSVRTGLFCVYEPEEPVAWDT